MTSHTIGLIALNFSTTVYLFWLLPQLAHNFKRRKTTELSLGMHSVLIMGYLSDLAYVIGRGLPLQSWLVTFCGLLSMWLMHLQFWIYQDWRSTSRKRFLWLTAFFAGCFALAFYWVLIPQSEALYNGCGCVSSFCWLFYLWPQLIKNYRQGSAAGLSLKTLYLTLFTGLGDVIAAYSLHWPWPSLVGTALGMIPKSLILVQYYYYQVTHEEQPAYAR